MAERTIPATQNEENQIVIENVDGEFVLKYNILIWHYLQNHQVYFELHVFCESAYSFQ